MMHGQLVGSLVLACVERRRREKRVVKIKDQFRPNSEDDHRGKPGDPVLVYTTMYK